MDSSIKKEAKNLKPLVRVGKSGLNDSLIDEIKKHLKKRKLVKVKFLKNSIQTDLKGMASEIARLTASELVFVVGFTAVFYNKRK